MAQRWVAVTIAIGVLVLPSVAFADVVWPALILEGRLWGWPSILAGLLVEGAVLVRGFGMPVRRAAIASLVMNGVSSVLGIVLIPLVGTIWDVFPGLVLYKVLGIGTFNLGTWVATFVLAVLANTIVELAVLRWCFQIPWHRPNVWILGAANVVSVAIAYASFLTEPIQW